MQTMNIPEIRNLEILEELGGALLNVGFPKSKPGTTLSSSNKIIFAKEYLKLLSSKKTPDFTNEFIHDFSFSIFTNERMPEKRMSNFDQLGKRYEACFYQENKIITTTNRKIIMNYAKEQLKFFFDSLIVSDIMTKMQVTLNIMKALSSVLEKNGENFYYENFLEKTFDKLENIAAAIGEVPNQLAYAFLKNASEEVMTAYQNYLQKIVELSRKQDVKDLRYGNVFRDLKKATEKDIREFNKAKGESLPTAAETKEASEQSFHTIRR